MMENLTHLDYYIKNNISPVHYDTANIREHFDRRASLYQALGLVPLTFRDSTVLEVAVGSGQNSLYVASLFPKSLTLVEPNPTGINEIQELFSATKVHHTPPILVESTLQNYAPDSRFDIVICENWLGRSSSERALLKKLASFVEANGILVVTTQPPSGLLANMIRRALMAKFSNPEMSFERRTEIGVAMFGPHLKTINAMTRSAKDWVQDNMLNPAYFDLCITIPDVLSEIGEDLHAIGTSPKISTDWRWFKLLYGEQRKFNEQLIEGYESNLHNLFDHEIEFYQPDLQLNKEIEKCCLEFIDSVRNYEALIFSGKDSQLGLTEIQETLLRIISKMKNYPLPIVDGLKKVLPLFTTSEIDYLSVAEPCEFSRLFGKENIYLSLLANKSA